MFGADELVAGTDQGAVRVRTSAEGAPAPWPLWHGAGLDWVQGVAAVDRIEVV